MYGSGVCHIKSLGLLVWEFPKIGVPLFGGPYNKDPTF